MRSAEQSGKSGTVECRSVVAIGSSAGGLPALVELIAALPPELPACVLITMHTPARAASRLPQILARAGSLPVQHAEDGAPLLAGHVYTAPPGRHLLIGDGVVRLSAGPRVSRHRPAADVMFASAARWAHRRTLAVVLSGALDDGAVGAALVARAGGRVIVQEPGEAAFGSMPRAALAAAPGAVAVPTARLGEVAGRMIGRMTDGANSSLEFDADGGRPMESSAAGGDDSPEDVLPAGDEPRPTRLVCPDCGGSLGRVDLPRISYFRCHVGHQYGPRALEAAQAEAAETKLWAAVAALEEHATWARELAEQPGSDGSADGDALTDAAAYQRAALCSAELARSVRSEIRRTAPGTEV